MRVLALDLGTRLGWAHGQTSGLTEDFGTELLAPESILKAARRERFDRRLDPRIPRLFSFLKDVHRVFPLDWIVFEDVQFASTTLQAHLWASLRGTVWVFAAENRLKIDCLATGKLKLFATGHGGADKASMERALRRDPKFSEKEMDDNAVDAVHLLKWSQHILKRA